LKPSSGRGKFPTLKLDQKITWIFPLLAFLQSYVKYITMGI